LELPSFNPVLEHSVLALCTARLGHQDGHEALFHESEKFCSTSMTELQQSILNPASRFNDQVITASFALTVHQLTSCPGGAMKLLQLHGPKSHTFVLAHSVLREVRMHSVSLLLTYPLFSAAEPVPDLPRSLASLLNLPCSKRLARISLGGSTKGA
jgi:hypothetical protein